MRRRRSSRGRIARPCGHEDHVDPDFRGAQPRKSSGDATNTRECRIKRTSVPYGLDAAFILEPSSGNKGLELLGISGWFQASRKPLADNALRWSAEDGATSRGQPLPNPIGATATGKYMDSRCLEQRGLNTLPDASHSASALRPDLAADADCSVMSDFRNEGFRARAVRRTRRATIHGRSCLTTRVRNLVGFSNDFARTKLQRDGAGNSVKITRFAGK